MTAFARAVAALHRDANLSVACEWYPGWDRDASRALAVDFEAEEYSLSTEGTAVRGIRSQEVAPTFGPGNLGGMAGREYLDLAITDLPADVTRGDTIQIGVATITVEAVERDVEALTWRITLSEA